MKRIKLVMLGIALAGFGCLPSSFVRDTQKPPQAEMKQPAPPPVLAEGITEKNAPDVAQKLRQELEYDDKRQAEADASRAAAAAKSERQ